MLIQGATGEDGRHTWTLRKPRLSLRMSFRCQFASLLLLLLGEATTGAGEATVLANANLLLPEDHGRILNPGAQGTTAYTLQPLLQPPAMPVATSPFFHTLRPVLTLNI
ncbi:hypothetical protein NDU88_000082 [Pleurodeles waltl]|uniref:Uncharacterized protein n=1 Tax=Pleurodeles waltl TaxID=8319 RepID=A0AAV7MKY8_PLEWA|nr:hypothetical protein NDU88_000082 [Pleurodeles waltl]